MSAHPGTNGRRGLIVTFTANPSVDRTAEVPELRRGAVLRATRTRIDGGGKGVNVTRALAANGYRSLAVLPAGGPEGVQLLDLLNSQQLDTRPVPIAGAVRANVTIVEPDGTTTKINEPGPTLSDDELHALTDALLLAADGAEWVVLSGSLPPGAPGDLYASLTERLHAAGTRVAVDTHGSALRASCAARPDLIKPNRRELTEASRMEVNTIADARAAADLLRAAGAGTVLASLGHDGAVLVEQGGSYHATAAVAAPRSTVGAGDAMLAGFLAGGATGPTALAEAVAWGTAAVSLPGSRMPTPIDLDRDAVRVTQLDTLEVTP
ncbi:MAG TPA: 1-phosphofructokinase [Solirubrobacteraceae bacterium]|nr:1-phosphofructokinase [Solirubrobacteraceae bacterium]